MRLPCTCSHGNTDNRLLVQLQHNRALPFPYFDTLLNIPMFPTLSSATVALMGISIPSVDYYYAKYIENKERQVQDKESHGIWERAEWSMPMRYLGGVVGFAWAASVSHTMPRLMLEITLDESSPVVRCHCIGCVGVMVLIR
jgi:hypothetical protein